MKNNVQYYGTDPNHLLVERLKTMSNDYCTVNKTQLKPKIICSGSETYPSELENTIGLAFSSPPYFSLEDYKIGNQSYKPGTTYEMWLRILFRTHYSEYSQVFSC